MRFIFDLFLKLKELFILYKRDLTQKLTSMVFALHQPNLQTF